MHRKSFAPFLAAALAAALLCGAALRAEDRVVKQDGSELVGKVTGMHDYGQLQLGGGAVALPLSLVKSVEMDPPAALTQAQDPATPPDRAVALLAPLVATYQGLPAEWVPAAMALLGNDYAALDKFDESNATFAALKKSYGESAAGAAAALPAKVGFAHNAFRQGHADEAATLIQPVIDDARKTLAHSAADGAALGKAFLLYGQILEAKGDAQGALGAYLTTTAVFDRDPQTVAEAKKRADALRAAHPGLAIL